jgi:hypothetical protein
MTKPDLSALADAVEQAWTTLPLLVGTPAASARFDDLMRAFGAFAAARRAARADGYRECLVSREAVEALRHSRELGTDEWDAVKACDLLARDLAGLLKED